MANHPNRGRPSASSNPEPAEIRAAREAAGHTQTAAAGVIHGTLRAWQDWEAGARRMPASAWELYRLMTGQHPEFVVTARE